MKTITIVQSNYIPWRGYFDLIRKSDQLVLLDTVQYTRRDWRNRNIIKTPSGLSWLTIPVEVKGRFEQSIDETRIVDFGWADRHIRTLEFSYRRAAGFDETAPWLFDALRRAANRSMLSEVNRELLTNICLRFSIVTPILDSTELIPRDAQRKMHANERLLQLCRSAGATRYLSGPAARNYLDESAFQRAGIAVAWMDYAGYPEYSQLWGPFTPAVSIVDLLLNCGLSAGNYLGRT